MAIERDKLEEYRKLLNESESLLKLASAVGLRSDGLLTARMEAAIRALIEDQDVQASAAEPNNPWNPIAEAPPAGKFLVKGDSGYNLNKTFIVLAHRDPEYRGDAWLFPGGDRISDMGWEPTHFRELTDADTQ